MRTSLLVAIILTAAAPAQQFDWTGTVNTTYSTPGNWSPVGPPGPAATARFNLATSYNVSFTGNATVDAISVNNGTVTWNLGGFTYNAPNLSNSGVGGSLTIKSGTFNAGGLSVGSNTFANSTLTLDFASTVATGAGGFSVGSNDVGFLVVKGLSTFTTANATTFVGANPTGVGTATVVGAGASWTANGTVRIGADGTGTVNVLNGGVMTAAAVNVGEGAFGTGTLNVSGLNATFTTAGTANVGGTVAQGTAAAAVLAVGPGATVNLNGTTNLKTTAAVNLTGGTLNLNTLAVEAGAAVNWASGKVQFANASTVTPGVLGTFLSGGNTLGANRTLAATAGTLTLGTPLVVDGGTVAAPTITVNAPLVVGPFGTVTATDAVTINAGQTVQVSDLGTLATTNPMFNNGTLQLNGPAARVAGFAFNLGVVQGTGRFAGGMNNSTLGTVRARAGDYLVIETSGLTNSGNIELSGGTVEFTKPLSNLNTGLISGRGEFRGNTSTPGGIGLANSGVVAFSGGTTDVRGDVQNNSGGVIVSAGGGVVTYYDDVVHNGAEIRTNAGSRTVFFGGQSGAGPFTGTGTVEYNGDLRPGNSPARVTYDGDVILNPSARFVAELGGTTPGSQYDQLTVLGSVAVGGELQLDFLNGFVPQQGQSFMLIENRGPAAIAGTFLGLPENSLFTAGGVMFHATYSGGNGNDFVVTPVPEPGGILLCGAAAAGWVTFWRRRWAAAAAVVVVALAVEPARADFEWVNGAGGQYNAAANWSPTGPPTLVGNASFAVNSTYSVTFTSAVTNDRLFVTAGDVTFNLGGFTATYNQVGNAFSSGSRVGSSAGATLRVKSGTLSIGTFETADFSTYTGTVVVDTGGHLNLTSGFNYFGRDGTSTVTVQNGGDLTTQATYVGRETTATGTVTVTGAGSTWAGSAVNVGEGGKGTLNVLAGGQASSTTFTLGGLATGQGTLTVSGAGSSLTASSNASIGFNGTATATVSNGGTATFGSLDIAERPGSAASLTVSGLGAAVNVAGGVTIGGASDALLSNGGTLTVGTGGSFTAGGTMTVRVPGTVNVNGGTLGVAGLVVQSGAAFNFSSGTVQMTTAGSLSDAFLTTVLGPTHRVLANRTVGGTTGLVTLDAPLTLAGGNLAVNTLVVNAPLLVQVNSTASAVGGITVSQGQTVQVDNFGTLAAGTTVANNGTIVLGGPLAVVTGGLSNAGLVRGTGRLAGGLANATNGTVRAGGGDYLTVNGAGPTNTGNIDLAGGTIEFTGPLTNQSTGFISGRGELRTGTASPGGSGVVNSGVMSFSGGTTDVRGDVFNQAGGRIVSAGGGVLTFYDDVTHNGTEVRTNAGSRTVFFGGQSGAGPFTGTGVVEYSGDLRPGNSPAKVTHEGDLVLNPSATLFAELGGTVAGSGYDQLSVNGLIDLGGELQLQFIDGFVPQGGQSFMLIENRGAGAINGTFSGLPEGGFATAGGVTFAASYVGGTGNDFVVTPVPEPGTLALAGVVAAGWLRRRLHDCTTAKMSG